MAAYCRSSDQTYGGSRLVRVKSRGNEPRPKRAGGSHWASRAHSAGHIWHPQPHSGSLSQEAPWMRPLDWVVLFAWLISLVSYGLYRGRGSDSVNKYLLAGKTMPWYAMALSILATQASAITFISTTGQGYVDGLRFVQFYFGLPVAMIILSATAVPIFHRARVYTAYEYLERRFDGKTRALVSLVFLVQRGLAAGIGLYAP